MTQFNKIITASASVVLFFILIWGINKGFDLSDEGAFILSCLEGQESFFGISKVFLLIKFFFSWLNLNIVKLRIIRFILTIASTFILFFGIKEWLKTLNVQMKNNQYFYLLFLFIGFALTYTYRTQTLAYNSLIYIFYSFASGSILYSINKKRTIYKLGFFIAGLLLPFGIIIKVSSALTFFVISVIFIVAYPLKETFKNRFFDFLIYFIGILFGILLLWPIIPITTFITEMTTAIPSTLSDGTHGITNMLGHIYLLSYQIFFHTAFATLWIFIYFVYTHYSLKIIKSKFIQQLGKVTYFVIFVLFLFIRFAEFEQRRGAELFLFLLILWGVYIVFMQITGKTKKPFFKASQIQLYYVTLFLFVLPFLGALGTDDLLIFNALNFVFFWFAIFIIFINLTNEIRFFQIKLGIISLISVLFFIKAFVLFPYRTESLIEHKKELNTSYVTKGMKIDKKTGQYIHEVDSILKSNGYKANDFIFTTLSGLIAAVDGRQAGTGYWVPSKYKNLFFKIKHSKHKNIRPFFILKKENSYSKDLIEVFKANNINFPEDYNMVGIAIDRRHNWKTYIYAPKNK